MPTPTDTQQAADDTSTETTAAAGSETRAEKGTETAKFITVDELDKKLNAAISSHLKRANKGIEDKLEGFFTSFTKKQQDDEEARASARRQSQAGQSEVVDAEAVKMRRDMEDLRKQLDAEKKARQESDSARKSERAHAELRAALNRVSVKPETTDFLVKAFKSDISYDEDGDAMLPVEGGVAPIGSAIELWAKSKDALPFMPPPSPGGTGATARSGGKASNYASKPRDQWSDAVREAFFQDRVRKNREGPS